MSVTYRPATELDVFALDANLRAADRDELQAGQSGTAIQNLRWSLANGETYTIESSGTLIAMLGVDPGGVIWMLGTDLVAAPAVLPAHRLARSLVTQFLMKHGTLQNYVWARNEAHVEWIKWLGFTFTGKDRIVDGEQFLHFEMNSAELALTNFRRNVMALEGAMRVEHQYIPLVRHYFAPGQYAREMTMAAGTLVTGKIHVHSHLNIVSKGFVSVFTEDGREDIRAPHCFTSKPGVKRVLLAHEETIWTTIHATELTDIDTIERTLVATTYEELQQLEGNKEPLCLSS